MKTDKTHIIKFGKKISEKQIDKFINDFYNDFSTIQSLGKTVIFQFAEVEWISNQELLVLTSILKYLVNCGIPFKVNFLDEGSSLNIDRRTASQIIQICEVWRIFDIIPDQEYTQYFDIDMRLVERLKNEFNITSTNNEIYKRYGVTPFVSLSKVDHPDDRRITSMLHDVFKLNNATSEILKRHNCLMPFNNQTLSSIVTKELYENFLDHFSSSFFRSEKNYAFMSLSVAPKLSDRITKIQDMLRLNFEEEAIPESKSFWYNERFNYFKNQSILQFSFLDFGDGIPTTLQKQFELKTGKHEHDFKNKCLFHSEILKFAFQFDSSKDPIDKRYIERSIIPRGLFDLITIVKRFNALLVARSNYGRAVFNFSNNTTLDDAYTCFGREDLFFPGTLITIYFPERTNEEHIEGIPIKPYYNDKPSSINNFNKRIINLSNLQIRADEGTGNKIEKYNIVFKLLIEELDDQSENSLIYLDFEGYELNVQLSKKLIYFLVSDYRINQRTNLIVINPPSKELLDIIKNEVYELFQVVTQYKIHPIPFVFYNKSTDVIDLYWLGLFLDEDIKRLNELLLDQHDLRRSDFDSPETIIGNVNYYDAYGNLVSVLNSSDVRSVLKNK